LTPKMQVQFRQGLLFGLAFLSYSSFFNMYIIDGIYAEK